MAVKNDDTGTVERIDLPMRASAGGYYSNLMRMYDHLGVPLHPIRFLFAFTEQLVNASRRATTASTYFIHASNLHQTPPPWPGNRGVLAHIVETLYLIVCHFWFSVACFLVPPRTGSVSSSDESCEGGESFADYLQRIRLPSRYASRYLLPLMCSVSTCTHSEMLSFPASDIVNYKKLSHGQQHYGVCGGVSQVQDRLAKGINDIRLGVRVLDVVPGQDNGRVLVKWQSLHDGADKIAEDVFDRVVLAVSPDVAAKIFKPLVYTAGKIPTVQVESSVIVPPRKGQDANTYSVVSEDDSSTSGCMHHGADDMPAQTITFRTQFSGVCPKTEALHTMPSGVVVSTCPLDDGYDPKKTLQTARFIRTLRTPESRAAVERIMGRARKVLDKKQDSPGGERDWVNGEDNVWLSGAWCWDGMVLLEGCIVSAMKVADDFGVGVPWRAAKAL